ncbi:TIGR01777 family oxidoreductase [Lapillicoccus sp.]|uniref:TIGR01777 family oxidoreductase n=1 Tax=Lapillicoccus sp. TaxID=1909287 RepID=UPI0025CC8319|nr:TIGR01777 family oxidoreductase [Lapillicoccus sp.]
MTSKRVAISGASGLIGGALSAFLTTRGDEVVHLVRREPRTESEIVWDPVARTLDPAALEGVDAVVHLAGAGVADKRWTPAYQQEILRSRSDGTATIATAVAAHGDRIRLVSGSAVGVYGSDRGDEVLTEESASGAGFLADVVRAWESATKAAVDAGASVAMARTGLVMSPAAGAFAPLVQLGRLGLGGPLGSGKQYWPWITLGDEVRALAHLVDHPDVTGPVNLVGPDPVPQIEVSRELGRQLHRPAILPAPAFALRIIVGGFASDILGSQRVMPTVLAASGFTHEQSTLAAAIATLL